MSPDGPGFGAVMGQEIGAAFEGLCGTIAFPPGPVRAARRTWLLNRFAAGGSLQGFRRTGEGAAMCRLNLSALVVGGAASAAAAQWTVVNIHPAGATAS